MFGTMFMALEGWISAAAVAHIYGKEPQDEDEYLSVNGSLREYSRQAFIGDGVSAAILRTFSLCVSRALPEVVRALRISVPLSTLELSLVKLTHLIMMHVTWFAFYSLGSMFSLRAPCLACTSGCYFVFKGSIAELQLLENQNIILETDFFMELSQQCRVG
jgi:hypothetical protein